MTRGGSAGMTIWNITAILCVGKGWLWPSPIKGKELLGKSQSLVIGGVVA